MNRTVLIELCIMAVMLALSSRSECTSPLPLFVAVMAGFFACVMWKDKN